MRVRLHIAKRGKWWQIEGYVDGQRFRQSTGTAKKSEAEQALDRLREQLGDPTYVPKAKAGASHSVTAAVAAFRESGLTGIAAGTARMYVSKAGHLARLLGDRDVATLAAADWDAFIAARRGEGAKDHTIAKELVTARRMLAFAESRGHLRAGWRAAFPARFRTGYDPRDRWLTEDEYQRLLAAVEPERRLWIVVAVYTGGRVSELERLQWSDVDFALGFVTLRTAKTRHGAPRKPRHIPIADELRAALEPVRGIGPVFPDPWANPALRLTQTARRIGICGPEQTLNDNDLRRTFASWMLQRGATVKEVADLLGHGSTAMVERVYGHLARSNLVAAVARLPRFQAP